MTPPLLVLVPSPVQCVGPFFGPCGIQTSWSATTLRSSQIESRGTVGGIVAGFFAAVPSGIGVALAITGGGINALVRTVHVHRVVSPATS